MALPGSQFAYRAGLLGTALLVSRLSAALAAATLPLDTPLPDAVPPGTELTVGATTATGIALKLSGEFDKLPFKLKIANITGGPESIAAFNGRALDLAGSADIPPIQAEFIGLDARIVAVRFRQDQTVPTYQFGIAAKAGIATLADLRGKRIAFSPGQAQGSVVVRTLKQFGIDQKEVQLIELPATGNAYLNALAANLVDAAPLAGIQVKRYVDQYGADGAKILVPDGVKDNPTNLWALTETLQNPAKAAAIRLYIAAWARASRWEDTHRAVWIEAAYVKDQGVSPEDARFIDQTLGKADIPANWAGAIESEQETIDLMAAETRHKPFPAAQLFDRRFETIAGQAYAAAEPEITGAGQ